VELPAGWCPRPLHLSTLIVCVTRYRHERYFEDDGDREDGDLSLGVHPAALGRNSIEWGCHNSQDVHLDIVGMVFMDQHWFKEASSRVHSFSTTLPANTGTLPCDVPNCR
jgi:hypothetical protein